MEGGARKRWQLQVHLEGEEGRKGEEEGKEERSEVGRARGLRVASRSQWCH